MAYNYPQSPPLQGNTWGQPAAPVPQNPYPNPNGQPYPANTTASATPTMDAAALTHQMQPVYQAPQFNPAAAPVPQTYPQPYAAATPTMDATALTPSMQPVYQAPQFAPPPPAPKQGGGVLKTLNFFSSKPSYQPNTGESSLSSPGAVSPPAGAGFGAFPGPQQYGTVSGQPAPQVYNHTAPVQQFNTAQYSPANGAGAPPPAYTPGAAGAQQWPEKSPVQPNPAQAPQINNMQNPNANQGQNAYNPNATNQGTNQGPHAAQGHNLNQNPNAAQGHNPNQTPNAAQNPNPNPQNPNAVHNLGSGNLQPQGQNVVDDSKYWTSLVQQGRLPHAPKPELRAFFRGIARCINKECIVDPTPQCVLSPTKMAMYYGIQPGYESRESQLFSRAQSAPATLLHLYERLHCEHLLIPSNPGDGKRKPHAPALTITGFEHWMLLTALMNPDAEYARLNAFVSAAGRQIYDDQGRPFPKGEFPRQSLPMGPDQWVVNRYGGFLEEALAGTGKSGKEQEYSEEEGLRAEIEALKKRLFESKSEHEKTNSQLESTNNELQRTNGELQRTNGELEGVKKQLAASIAKADEAVAKMSASWGINQQQQPQQPQQQQQQPQQQQQQPQQPQPQQQQPQHQQQPSTQYNQHPMSPPQTPQHQSQNPYAAYGQQQQQQNPFSSPTPQPNQQQQQYPPQTPQTPYPTSQTPQPRHQQQNPFSPQTPQPGQGYPIQHQQTWPQQPQQQQQQQQPRRDSQATYVRQQYQPAR